MSHNSSQLNANRFHPSDDDDSYEFDDDDNDQEQHSNYDEQQAGSYEGDENDEDSDDDHESQQQTTKHREWLYDRINGRSRVGNGRPPCFLCYPSPLLRWCPFALEENIFCTTLGWIGCLPSNLESARSCVMLLAFLVDLMGLGSLMFATMAVSTSTSLLKRTPWVVGVVTTGTNTTELAQVTVRIGLRAILLRDDSTGDDRTVLFDEFCDLTNAGIEQYIDVGDCSKCADASRQFIVLPLLVAVVLCIPSLFSDILREYSNYDVNCQRCSAWVTSSMSVVGAMVAWNSFYNECLPTFLDEDTIIPDPGIQGLVGEVRRTYEWADGIGLYFIYASAAFRGVSFLTQCLLPTPTITRNQIEQAEYERIPYSKYMKHASESMVEEEHSYSESLN